MTGQQNKTTQLPPPPREGWDLRRLLTMVRKRRWMLLSTATVVASSTVMLLMSMPAVYEGEAAIIVDPQAPNVLGGRVEEVVELGARTSWFTNREYNNTQRDILTSFSLARSAVTKYGLHKDRRWIVEPPAGASEDEIIDGAATELQRKIKVKPARDSRVIVISLSMRDPTLAADLANYVAETYIERNLTVKHGVTESASGWVAKQLDEAREQLDKSETALYMFLRDNNILSVSLEDRLNLLSKALESFSAALTDARLRRIGLQARRKSIQTILDVNPAETPFSYVADVPQVGRLREQYLGEEGVLAGLRERYGDKHPSVATQRAEVEAALAALQREGAAIMRSIDGEIRALLESEQRFDTELTKLTNEALELNKKGIEHKRLMRAAENTEQAYASLLKRLTDSELQAKDRANNISLLDAARPSKHPAWPDIRIAAVLGLLLGLTMAFGAALFVEYIDRTVKSQDDVESVLGLPFLGLIPSVPAEKAASSGSSDLFVAREPKSTVAESCRVVRTNILFCSADRPLKTIVVTSSNPAEGKTIMAMQLGITMAQSNQRTLVVDTDMRRPRIHKSLRIPNDNGVSRVIVGESDIESAIHATDVPNLFVMPCGPIPPNPAELLQSERFAAMVKKLSESFDRVIFDSPPILAVTDATLLSRVTDGLIIVIRAGRTSRDAVQRVRHTLSLVNAHVIGAVLNDVNLRSPHYAYYYSYYRYQYKDTPSDRAPARGSAEA
ncbi:MAG: polysaccharide biosynthesis tyrosine autokinase [Pseudomonadota bacterium]